MKRTTLRPFVPAWLDELGLRPTEFRVLANLWRRADQDGYSYPSAARVARDCRIHVDTVWPVLSKLEEIGLLRRRKTGRGNLFEVLVPGAPSKNFGPKNEAQPTGNGGAGPLETDGLTHWKPRVLDSLETEGYQGSPVKESRSNSASLKKPIGPGFQGESRSEPANWRRVAPSVKDRAWSDLSPEHQEEVCARLDAPFVAEPEGWRAGAGILAEFEWVELTHGQQVQMLAKLAPGKAA